MIVYNQDKIGIKYLTEDHVIFELNSTRKLDELLQMLMNGEDISSVAAVSGVVEKDASFTHKTYQSHVLAPEETTEIREKVPNYFLVMDEDYDDNSDHFVPARINAVRPYMQERETYLFSQYEKRMMGARDAKVEFEPYQITDESARHALMEHIAYSIGIMPSILHAPTAQRKTVAELKKLSQVADIAYNHGIADYFSNNYPDLLPTYETAEMVQKLSNSERELITDGVLDPMLLTDFIKAKKAALGNKVMLTEDDVDIICDCRKGDAYENTHIITTYLNRALDKDYIAKDRYVLEAPTTREKHQLLVSEATKLFQEKFHFVPRVIDAYCKAYIERHYGAFADAKIGEIPKMAEQLVEEFNRTSLAKVAAFNNKVLYALSPSLNFASVKEDHMLAMGVFYPERLLASLEKNNFVEYYKAHGDISLGELTKLLRLYRTYTDLVFDVAKSPKELISVMENAKGVADCQKMEHNYNYRFADNDIAIRGRNILAVDGNMKMYTLPADDYRNFTVGYDTNCCQHYGSAGETCVWKLTTDPFAANVVIERNGKILAQGFVWTDEAKDTIVFDNVEFADDRSVQQFNDLFAEWSRAMPYKNVHVGVGYNQGMQSWGTRIKSESLAHMPGTLSNGHVYSDYHANARTLKENGIMKINPMKDVRIVHQPLIPSKYDVLNNLGLTYLISTGFGVDKLSEIVGKMQAETLSEDEYKDLFRACKNIETLLNNMQHIPERIQLWLSETYGSKVTDKIQNPCDAILVKQIESNPAKIKFMENPTEEMQLAVVRANGMFLGEINNQTDAVIETAVMSNGVALTMVPPERQTDALKLLAISSWAKVIASIESPTEEMINTALDQEPTAVSLIRGEIPLSCQLRLVENHPSSINDIPSPHPTAVMRAIERDGMLIRNFQNHYPELRRVALNQTPFAIGALNRPTDEELEIALTANRNVLSSIRNKEAHTRAEVFLQMRDAGTDMDNVELDYAV